MLTTRQAWRDTADRLRADTASLSSVGFRRNAAELPEIKNESHRMHHNRDVRGLWHTHTQWLCMGQGNFASSGCNARCIIFAGLQASPVRDLLYQRVLQAAYRRIEGMSKVWGIAADHALQSLQAKDALLPVNVRAQGRGDGVDFQEQFPFGVYAHWLTGPLFAIFRATATILHGGRFQFSMEGLR